MPAAAEGLDQGHGRSLAVGLGLDQGAAGVQGGGSSAGGLFGDGWDRHVFGARTPEVEQRRRND